MKKHALIYLLVAACCLAGCKKDDTGSPAPLQPLPAKWNFAFTIDGVNKQWLEDDKTWGPGIGSLTWANNGSFLAVNYVSMDNLATYESLEIEKGRLNTTTLTPTFAERMTLFAKDSASFTDSTWTSDGVIVNYTDSGGKKWSTAAGPQSGSWFYISDNKQSSFYSISILYFTANFSCKVYDAQGNMKQITNAVIKSGISSND